MTRLQGRWLCVVAWALALGVATTARAQTRWIDNGSASLAAFAWYWQTVLDPPTPPLSGGFGTAVATTAPNEVHRVLLDHEARVYFGYTVRIEPRDGNTFQLTFRPLSLTTEIRARLGADASSWTPLPAPAFPAAQVIRGGQVLELHLLSNDAWGQRVTEYVTVQEPPRVGGFAGLDRAPREFAFAAGAPRDFTVEDVYLRLHEPRVFLNGTFQESSARTLGDEAGAVVWIYIPGRGRFLLSVVPNARLGFQRVGEIRGSSLRFTIGGETYSIASGSRIAPGTSAYHLYVLQQREWRPSYAHANLEVTFIGAADRVEDALSN